MVCLTTMRYFSVALSANRGVFTASHGNGSRYKCRNASNKDISRGSPGCRDTDYDTSDRDDSVVSSEHRGAKPVEFLL
jgi:hypothetical protein